MLAKAVHEAGGRIIVQINHGGMNCSRESVTGTIAPSALNEPYLTQPSREMTEGEILQIIDAYAQAARRAREAGMDGVQIHGAHGYLISQFLSPLTNRRTDQWGGDAHRRMAFLRSVAQAVRQQVGSDYPVIIKLGMVDGKEGGLTPEDALGVVAELQGMGVEALEISSGVSAGAGPRFGAIRPGIRTAADEAYFRPIAHLARQVTRMPILLVGGLRSKIVMEDVLASGDADFVSLCRPLICEPDLPNRFRQGLQDRSGCISGNRCWAEAPNEGVACKCPKGEA
jgi:2,4-dienoyl-CoA reductase-like NADH-dependent reductase (Old Yellow Enzyme family)